MITSDLEYLGRRLDAVQDAGHKGAHAEVDRVDASRFVAGTYLVLGDILRLSEGPAGNGATAEEPASPEARTDRNLAELAEAPEPSEGA